MRAEALRRKSVERLAAFAATPEISHRRHGFAIGTGKTFAARRVRHFRHRARLHQSVPAIQQDEHADDSEPKIFRPDRKRNQSGDADKSDDARDEQTVGASKNKPEQRAQDLSAVERINRQHIKNEQDEVDIKKHEDEIVGVQICVRPADGFSEHE